ncbi:MAG TPA: AMP-binding protein, partial [Thermoanaerobaculia bacterium]
KGVAIEHRSAAALLDWAIGRVSPEERAGVLAATSISFDLSVFELFLPLTTGGAAILGRDALELPTLPAAADVTLVNTVPSAMAELLRLGGLPPAVRTVCLAGEPLPARLADAVYEQPQVRRLWNLYGPSEDSTYSTASLVARGTVPTIGRPLPGTQARLLDAAGQPMLIGTAGELCLGGLGLARGYLDRPELTAERFVPDPWGEPGARLYRTGDLARLRASGEIEFLGRLDHQVKVRGFRIELGEIEAVLAEHPAVAAAAVLVAVRTGGGRLVAFWSAREGADASPSELRAFLAGRLPEVMVPSSFSLLAALPQTSNGKVDRRALAELAAAERAPAAEEGEDAATPFEERIAAIFREVLEVERVSAVAGFFEIGGHSLLATRVTSRLRSSFGVDLPVRVLFEAPTVRELALRVEAAVGSDGEPAVPPLGPREVPADRPLSSAQERLWFLDRLEGGAAYNVPFAIAVAGQLAPLHVAAVLTEIVRRHEALRSTFVEGAGGPEQVVAPAETAAVPLPVVDLAALAAASR